MLDRSAKPPQDCVAKLLGIRRCITWAADKVKKREIDFDTLEQDPRAQWVETANITGVIIAEPLNETSFG